MTYLGEGSTELSDKKPWYIEAPPPMEPVAAAAATEGPQRPDAIGPLRPAVAAEDATATIERLVDDQKRRRREKAIRREDPLTDVQKYLRIKSAAANSASSTPKSSSGHKSAAVASSSSGSASLEKLRQERLQREADERARVADLKARHTGVSALSSSSTPQSIAAAYSSDRQQQRYSQQFNPQYARGSSASSSSNSSKSTKYSDKYRVLLGT